MWQQAWQNLLSSTVLFTPRLLVGLVILVGFWIAGVVGQRIVTRLSRVRRLDPSLISLMGRTVKAAALVWGLIVALGTVGIDVTALVAGLGLTGFALGFALKDIISNALSGVLVLLYKPFKQGDRVLVTGLDGTVIDINLRYTILDSQDKVIFIPNASLFSHPVNVMKASPADAARDQVG